jgi:hypothetical protein
MCLSEYLFQLWPAAGGTNELFRARARAYSPSPPRK